jgi:hypothetical protein
MPAKNRQIFLALRPGKPIVTCPCVSTLSVGRGTRSSHSAAEVKMCLDLVAPAQAADKIKSRPRAGGAVSKSERSRYLQAEE